MKRSIPFILLFSLSAVLWTGCRTEGARPALNATKFDLENREKFVLLDKGAQRSVTYSGLQERPLEDGRLEVAVNLRNRENRRIQVQVDCQFKDAQGFVVDEVPFENVILTENEQRGLKFASRTKADRYTIRVRQAR